MCVCGGGGGEGGGEEGGGVSCFRRPGMSLGIFQLLGST